MKKLSVFLLFLFICSIQAYGMSSNNSPFIVILSPKPHAVLCEGKTYTIRWEARNIKKLRIDLLIGGHYAGTIGDCAVDAKKKQIVWHVERGFVSGFGVNHARVKIYLCNKKEDYCKIRRVIVKSVCVNPIRLKPKPISPK